MKESNCSPVLGVTVFLKMDTVIPCREIERTGFAAIVKKGKDTMSQLACKYNFGRIFPLHGAKAESHFLQARLITVG